MVSIMSDKVDVLSIVRGHLINYGYDGLYSPDYGDE